MSGYITLKITGTEAEFINSLCIPRILSWGGRSHEKDYAELTIGEHEKTKQTVNYSIKEMHKLAENEPWGELSELDKQIIFNFLGYAKRNPKLVKRILEARK